jgi:hypothetical protein
MCADDGSSNIWTIQNRFETKQNSDKPTMSPRKSTNRGNSATRIVGASSVAPASSSVIGVVTAYGQVDTRSNCGGTTEAVADDKGNPRVRPLL